MSNVHSPATSSSDEIAAHNLETRLIDAGVYPLGPTLVKEDCYNFFYPDINIEEPSNRTNFVRMCEQVAFGIWDGRLLASHMSLAHHTSAVFAAYDIPEVLEDNNWGFLIQSCDLAKAQNFDIQRYHAHAGNIDSSGSLAYRVCIETNPRAVELDALQFYAFKLFLSSGDLSHIHLKEPKVTPLDQLPLGDLILLAGYLNMTVDIINDFAVASNGHNPNMIQIAQLLSKEFIRRDGLQEFLFEILRYIPPAASLNFSSNSKDDLIACVKTRLAQSHIEVGDYERDFKINWKSRIVLGNFLDLVMYRVKEPKTKRERKADPILQIGQDFDRSSLATIITNHPVSCYRLFIDK